MNSTASAAPRLWPHSLLVVLASALLLPSQTIPITHAEIPLPQIARLKSSPVLQHLKPNPLLHPAQPGPEETLAQMHVTEGFRVDLVAAEPNLHQPVAFAFDERGRIWVVEAHSYPTKRPAGQGLDRILILEDTNGNGTFSNRKVFAEGLNLVSGIEVGHGGVWVGAAPELLFIPDRNHDDIPDGPPQVLLDGFGFQDTHECLNSFMWGPDGWLYGNQGVFNTAHIGKPGAPDSERTELRAGVWRYHPTQHRFEVFAHGGSNPWGLDYDEHGQIFMTHCRSYYGRGLTTHVIQGGHYWNQANANHAPFIINNPPDRFPDLRNYLLASARYDHGAGGAGAPGSDAIYGGHSHVGTMIYLGDNWPETYRGHLFTHNLHGHQINQQINRPLGSGFDTVHAGKDLLFCSDPAYVPVDLQYGPDGAVYIIDWYDLQHCHNPNTERWDRSTGRIYRLAWAATYKPRPVDLGTASDAQLIAYLTHPNAWFSRTARRLLQERNQPLSTPALASLDQLFHSPTNALHRLEALWTLHATHALSTQHLSAGLNDPDPYVRAWSIQLGLDQSQSPTPPFLQRLVALATTDPSPIVHLYLASAAQHVPDPIAWSLLEALARHDADITDRNLPLLLWQSIASLMPRQPARALTLARSTRIPILTDFILWYAATLDHGPLNQVIDAINTTGTNDLPRRLAGLRLALEPRGPTTPPAAWTRLAPKLLTHSNPRVRRDAEQIASLFGDRSILPKLRHTLAEPTSPPDEIQHALQILNRIPSVDDLPALIPLLDRPNLRDASLPILSRIDHPNVPAALIQRLASFPPKTRDLALNALVQRASFASKLLDAVDNKTLPRNLLTAHHIRLLGNLKNPDLDQRITSTWGRVHQSPAEKQALTLKLEQTFNEAPLWAYDSRAGREHFLKLCAQCHVLGPDGTRVGPELTGAGRNGIRYFLENIVDPNAVVGTDFQVTTLDLNDGETLSGLVTSETPSSLTLRTTTAESIVPKSTIRKRTRSETSLMPEGLLESLGDRERLELLKFLTSN